MSQQCCKAMLQGQWLSCSDSCQWTFSTIRRPFWSTKDCGPSRAQNKNKDGGWVSAWVSCFIMGRGDRCAVYGFKNDRQFKDKHVIKPHINSFDGSGKLRFWKCRNADHYKTWTKLLTWQTINYTVSASVNSTCAQLPPTPSPPRATDYFKWIHQS